MPEFNATFLFVFISFLVFMLLMKCLFFDPMLRIKQAREQKLLDDEASTRQFEERYAQVSAEYQEALQTARQEAHRHILEARQTVKAEAQTRLREAQASAQAETDRQMTALAEWRETTYRQLESERGALVRAMIAKVTANDKVGIGPEHVGA